MSSQETPATGYPQPPPTGPAQVANGYHPGAAGYPYSAPPPHANYYYSANSTYPNSNPYYYQQQQPYSDQRILFRRLLAGVVGVFIIFAVVLFIIWLVVRPKVPDFHLNSLSVSHLNATASEISGNWTAQVTAFNPNSKMHVYYDEIEGFIYYGTKMLAQNRLPPFDQGTKSQTNFSASFVASSAYVDIYVVSGINGDKSRGNVRFTVRLLAVVHFKTGGWRTRRRVIRVFCDGVTVGIPSNSSVGTSTGGSKDCAVGI